MTVALTLAFYFVECLLLVLAIDAAQRGKRIYVIAAAGLGAVLLAGLADGFMVPAEVLVLRLGGLALAGVILAIDLLFEEVVIEDDEPRRIRS
jgi:hypothetical protein